MKLGLKNFFLLMILCWAGTSNSDSPDTNELKCKYSTVNKDYPSDTFEILFARQNSLAGRFLIHTHNSMWRKSSSGRFFTHIHNCMYGDQNLYQYIEIGGSPLAYSEKEIKSSPNIVDIKKAESIFQDNKKRFEKKLEKIYKKSDYKRHHSEQNFKKLKTQLYSLIENLLNEKQKKDIEKFLKGILAKDFNIKTFKHAITKMYAGTHFYDSPLILKKQQSILRCKRRRVKGSRGKRRSAKEEYITLDRKHDLWVRSRSKYTEDLKNVRENQDIRIPYDYHFMEACLDQHGCNCDGSRSFLDELKQKAQFIDPTKSLREKKQCPHLDRTDLLNINFKKKATCAQSTCNEEKPFYVDSGYSLLACVSKNLSMENIAELINVGSNSSEEIEELKDVIYQLRPFLKVTKTPSGKGKPTLSVKFGEGFPEISGYYQNQIFNRLKDHFILDFETVSSPLSIPFKIPALSTATNGVPRYNSSICENIQNLTLEVNKLEGRKCPRPSRKYNRDKVLKCLKNLSAPLKSLYEKSLKEAPAKICIKLQSIDQKTKFKMASAIISSISREESGGQKSLLPPFQKSDYDYKIITSSGLLEKKIGCDEYSFKNLISFNKNKDNQRTKQTPGQTTTQQNIAKSNVYTPIESMVDLSKVDPRSLSFDKDEFIKKCVPGFPKLSYYPGKGLTKKIIEDDLKNGCKNDNLDKCSIESLSCHQSRQILTGNSILKSLPEVIRKSSLNPQKRLQSIQAEFDKPLTARQHELIDKYTNSCFEFESHYVINEAMDKCKSSVQSPLCKLLENYDTFRRLEKYGQQQNLEQGFMNPETMEVNHELKKKFAICQRIPAKQRVSCINKNLTRDELLEMAKNLKINPDTFFDESFGDRGVGTFLTAAGIKDGTIVYQGVVEGGKTIQPKVEKNCPKGFKNTYDGLHCISKAKTKTIGKAGECPILTNTKEGITRNCININGHSCKNEHAQKHIHRVLKSTLNKGHRYSSKSILRKILNFSALQEKAKTICRSVVNNKAFAKGLSDREYLSKVEKYNNNEYFDILGTELKNITVKFKLNPKNCTKYRPKFSPIKKKSSFKCSDFGIVEHENVDLDKLKDNFRKHVKRAHELYQEYKDLKPGKIASFFKVGSAGMGKGLACFVVDDYTTEFPEEELVIPTFGGDEGIIGWGDYRDWCSSEGSRQTRKIREAQYKAQKEFEEFKQTMKVISETVTRFPILGVNLDPENNEYNWILDLKTSEPEDIFELKYNEFSELIQTSQRSTSIGTRRNYFELNLSALNKDIEDFCGAKGDQNQFLHLLQGKLGQDLISDNPGLKGVRQCLIAKENKAIKAKENAELFNENLVMSTCLAAGVATMAPPPARYAGAIGDTICTIHYLYSAFGKLSKAQHDLQSYLRCIYQGDKSCSTEEVGKVYEKFSNAKDEKTMELVGAVLFGAGAVFDAVNLAHHWKFQSANRRLTRLIGANASKSAIKAASKEALEELKHVYKKLLKIDDLTNDDLLKLSQLAGKNVNPLKNPRAYFLQKNRLEILRNLGFEKIKDPSVRRKMFDLLTENPEIIDALRSGFHRGLRPKRSILRGLFENETALKEMTDVLSDPATKQKFINWMKMAAKHGSEKQALKAMRQFFKDSPEMTKIIQHNLDLLKPLSRSKQFLDATGGNVAKLFTWMATAPFKAIKANRQQLAALRAEIRGIEELIENTPGAQVTQQLQEQMEKLRKSQRVKTAKAALGKIKQILEAGEETVETAGSPLRQKIDKLLEGLELTTDTAKRRKAHFVKRLKDAGDDPEKLRQLYREVSSFKETRDNLKELGLLKEFPCYH